MLSAIFSELTSMCTEEQIEKTSGFWKIQIFLIISGIWAITQYNFGKSGFGKPVKNDFNSSRETFWRKHFFEDFYKSDLFLNLGKKRLAGCPNCFYVSSGTVLESWTFLRKSKFVLSNPQNLWTFPSTSNEICRVLKLAFNIFKGTFWGKTRLNETVFRFSPCFDSEQKKHWVELSHLLPRCRRECSERKHNFELYSISSNLAEWLLVELRTAIYVFKRTFSATFFWKSVFYFDSRTLSRNLVSLFTKCFRHFFQNWHPSV